MTSSEVYSVLIDSTDRSENRLDDVIVKHLKDCSSVQVSFREQFKDAACLSGLSLK